MKKKLFVTALLAFMMFSAVGCLKSGEQSSVQSSETIETPVISESSETSEEGEKEEIYYTVTFDSNGGSEVASMSVLAGEKLSKPADPQKSSSSSEYEFLYWEYNGEEWDFEKNVVTESLTLVAKWKEVASYTPPFLPKD